MGKIQCTVRHQRSRARGTCRSQRDIQRTAREPALHLMQAHNRQTTRPNKHERKQLAAAEGDQATRESKSMSHNKERQRQLLRALTMSRSLTDKPAKKARVRRIQHQQHNCGLTRTPTPTDQDVTKRKTQHTNKCAEITPAETQTKITIQRACLKSLSAAPSRLRMSRSSHGITRRRCGWTDPTRTRCARAPRTAGGGGGCRARQAGCAQARPPTA